MTSVSVVIPTLNEETYLPKLLSQLTPTLPPIVEIIVVDGQSSDGTRTVASSFGVEIITSTRGVARQRSLGCLRAMGQYVLLLDADTSISPVSIKKWIELAQERNLDISIPRYVPNTTSRLTRWLFAFLNRIFLITASSKASGAGCGILVKRSVFESILFDPRTSFDDIAFIRRASRSYRFGVVDDIELRVSDRRFKEEGLKAYVKYLVLSVFFCFDIFIFSSIVSYHFGSHEPQ